MIPISLRVSLDMAKTMYGIEVEKDAKIPGTVHSVVGVADKSERILDNFYP